MFGLLCLQLPIVMPALPSFWLFLLLQHPTGMMACQGTHVLLGARRHTLTGIQPGR
jgi:hypothetical protein